MGYAGLDPQGILSPTDSVVVGHRAVDLGQAGVLDEVIPVTAIFARLQRLLDQRVHGQSILQRWQFAGLHHLLQHGGLPSRGLLDLDNLLLLNNLLDLDLLDHLFLNDLLDWDLLDDLLLDDDRLLDWDLPDDLLLNHHGSGLSTSRSHSPGGGHSRQA